MHGARGIDEEAHTRPFRFRGHAAINLRKRQDDEAKRELAEAMRTRAKAETNVDTASAAVDESMQLARQALKSTASVTDHAWHRNWIVSRQEELATRRTTLGSTREAEQLARQRAQDTRRALRSLERWFERVWRRYQEEQRRVEQRELDEMGVLRYVTRQRARGGS